VPQRGYGVLFANPRATRSYGDHFATCNRGWWGEGDPPDLLAALDASLRCAATSSTGRNCVLRLAETVSYAPVRSGGAGVQQPGSPGRPQHAARVRRRRNMFTVQRSAFQRAEPGWVTLRDMASRPRVERGTSTPSSWPLWRPAQDHTCGVPLRNAQTVAALRLPPGEHPSV
jgi:hypothetical protein